MPNLGGWELVILVGILVLLFGFKRLPDMARSIGQSARVFKGEMKGMKTEEAKPADPAAAPPPAQLPPTQSPPAEPAPAQAAAQAAAQDAGQNTAQNNGAAPEPTRTTGQGPGSAGQ